MEKKIKNKILKEYYEMCEKIDDWSPFLHYEFCEYLKDRAIWIYASELNDFSYKIGLGLPTIIKALDLLNDNPEIGRKGFQYKWLDITPELKEKTKENLEWFNNLK